jgi:hypothetical protein
MVAAGDQGLKARSIVSFEIGSKLPQELFTFADRAFGIPDDLEFPESHIVSAEAEKSSGQQLTKAQEQLDGLD